MQQLGCVDALILTAVALQAFTWAVNSLILHTAAHVHNGLGVFLKKGKGKGERKGDFLSFLP